MDTPPDFSIITPSYNYNRYIRDCIESVLDQKYVTLEHIVFDAGSTDGTLDILAEYPHLKLTVEPDKGMSDAINKGFRQARGKWVMWLNSDDKLLPNALYQVKRFIEEHPEADIVHGGWNFVQADGTFIRSMKALPALTPLLIHHGCYIASTALFLKRESTIAQGMLLNEDFRYVMDGEFYARLALAGKHFCALNLPLADFRLHDAALSARNYAQKSLDDELKRQKQHAEPAAVRRAYGLSLFSSHHANNVVDAILFELGRVAKLALKVISPWKKPYPLPHAGQEAPQDNEK